jgi:hypothetical protein
MDDKVKYLLSLSAVRERAKIVGEAAEAGKLSHFDVHEERLGEAADYVTSVIKVCCSTLLTLVSWRLLISISPARLWTR